MGGRGSSSGITSIGGAPALNKDLVRRANAAGAFVDYGDATKREYERNVKTIEGLNLTKSEKQAAYKELHKLTENQLKAEAKAVSPYTSGPARFNKSNLQKATDKISAARSNVKSFMNGLEKKSRQASAAQSSKNLAGALKTALSSGALSFTFEGKTYTRTSTRSKSFTTK